MEKVSLVLARVLVFAFSGVAEATDLDKAPPSFRDTSTQVVPIDISEYQLALQIDASDNTTLGVARLTFTTKEIGQPMIRFHPTEKAVLVDGAPVGALKRVQLDHSASVAVVPVQVAPGKPHTLEIHYSFNREVTFHPGGIGYGWFMSDLKPFGFLDRYAPANFEFDSFPISLTLKLSGAEREHQLFSNGSVLSASGTEWRVEFPAYFSSSSPYLHLSDAGLKTARAEYAGKARKFPIVSYAHTQELAKGGLSSAQRVLKELEDTYGPYAHESLTLFVTEDDGGMEYCGATMTSLWALPHEVTHSWFARGVMPADGNAGWLDEATASWRDGGYQSLARAPSAAEQLSGFSPYRVDTPLASYQHGSEFLAHLDYLMRDRGGLKAALREWFSDKQRRTVTTPEFEAFIAGFLNADVGALFARYVYGAGGGNNDALHSDSTENPGEPHASIRANRGRHPRKYTEEEIRRYR